MSSTLNHIAHAKMCMHYDFCINCPIQEFSHFYNVVRQIIDESKVNYIYNEYKFQLRLKNTIRNPQHADMVYCSENVMF